MQKHQCYRSFTCVQHSGSLLKVSENLLHIHCQHWRISAGCFFDFLCFHRDSHHLQALINALLTVQSCSIVLNHFNNTQKHYSHPNTSEFGLSGELLLMDQLCKSTWEQKTWFFLASFLAFLKQKTLLVQKDLTGYTNPEGNWSFILPTSLLNTLLCICRKCTTALVLKPSAAFLLIFLNKHWCE